MGVPVYSVYSVDSQSSVKKEELLPENRLAQLPSFSESFPKSKFIAPLADIVTGRVEGGLSLTAGVAAAVSFLAGPEFWWITVPTAPYSLESGWDAYGRIKDAIDRLGE